MKTLRSYTLVIAAIGLLSTACGSEMQGFGSKDGTLSPRNLVEDKTSQTNIGDDVATSDDPNASSTSKPGLGGLLGNLPGLGGATNGGASLTSNAALANCLKEWGSDHPFTAAEIQNPKVITSSNVASFKNEIIDYSVTTKPRLTLVSYAAVAGGNISLNLQNPNGWYCIDVRAVALSNFKAKVHCKANVAQYKSSMVLGVGISFEKTGC